MPNTPDPAEEQVLPPDEATPMPTEPVTTPETNDFPTEKGSRGPLLIGAGVIALLLIGGLSFAFMKSGGNDSGSAPNDTLTTAADQACGDEYKQLLSASAFDFSVCTKSTIRSGKYESGATAAPKNKLVVVFDSSGSMAAKVHGEEKMTIAKRAAKKFLDTVAGDAALEVSMVAYGHKGGNTESEKAASCAGIEEIYEMAPVNALEAKATIDTLSATGWTPIADSLNKAERILTANAGDSNIILLVSDGKETCGGDPVAVVNKLKTGSNNIITSVIGFDVAGDDETQLKAIANAGGGNYFSVKSDQEFESAFKQHKESLDRIDFKIGRTIEQLYDISHVTNIYTQCLAMLEREQASMMLDIHASELAGKECVGYADKAYSERVTDLRNQIQTTYEADKATFGALKE